MAPPLMFSCLQVVGARGAATAAAAAAVTHSAPQGFLASNFLLMSSGFTPTYHATKPSYHATNAQTKPVSQVQLFACRWSMSDPSRYGPDQ